MVRHRVYSGGNKTGRRGISRTGQVTSRPQYYALCAMTAYEKTEGKEVTEGKPSFPTL